MDGVYNRSLFAKKATEARDKLRQMGGVQPMPQQPQAPAPGISGMMQPPRGAAPMGGIMSSSPELMQAAMRKPVVLPTTNQPTAAPAPAPQPQMLPPSQPIPNIAGIPQQQPQQRRAQPQAPQQKKPVKKLQEGGILDYTGPRSGMSLREKFQNPGKTTMKMFQRGVETPFTLSFKKAVEFGQKAITSEDPAKLGIPEGAADKIKAFGKADKSPEEVGAAITKMMPEKEKTGDLKKDLKKALELSGVEDVPAEVEVDDLNNAIMGAQLGAAIAGSYVNPQTGQELRPTAGARIGQAVSQGLALKRDTAEKREAQDAAMKLAQAKAASKGTSTSTKLTGADKELMDMFADRVKSGEDPAQVAEDFNRDIPGSGDRILAYLQGAPLGGGGTGSQPMTPIEKARYAISQGADRQEVIDRLVAAGIDPGEL